MIEVKAWAQASANTIRELKRLRFWVLSLSAAGLCFLGGPFGTQEALGPVVRLFYWVVIVTVPCVPLIWTINFALSKGWSSFSQLILVSFLFSIAAAFIIVLLSSLILPWVERFPGLIQLSLYSGTSCFVVCLCLSLFFVQTGHPSTKQEGIPILFKRLQKFPHADELISLQANDHYVEVVTNLGSELCLLRLSDAIEEAAPTEGFLIHRSTWVSKNAVQELLSHGQTREVRLSDGKTHKISKARFKDFALFLKGETDLVG